MCAVCQLLRFDPLSRPIFTLVQPFLLHQYANMDENEAEPEWPKQATRFFMVNREHLL